MHLEICSHLCTIITNFKKNRQVYINTLMTYTKRQFVEPIFLDMSIIVLPTTLVKSQCFFKIFYQTTSGRICLIEDSRITGSGSDFVSISSKGLYMG